MIYVAAAFILVVGLIAILTIASNTFSHEKEKQETKNTNLELEKRRELFKRLVSEYESGSNILIYTTIGQKERAIFKILNILDGHILLRDTRDEVIDMLISSDFETRSSRFTDVYQRITQIIYYPPRKFKMGDVVKLTFRDNLAVIHKCPDIPLENSYVYTVKLLPDNITSIDPISMMYELNKRIEGPSGEVIEAPLYTFTVSEDFLKKI